jgi:hypothetical protein
VSTSCKHHWIWRTGELAGQCVDCEEQTSAPTQDVERLKAIATAAEDLAVAMNVVGIDGRDRIERAQFDALRSMLRPSESKP